MRELNRLSYSIIGVAMRVHTELGTGMSESAYETVLASALSKEGHAVRRQVAVPLHFEGERVGQALKVDLLVDERIIIEIKATRAIGLHHIKQVVTYLKALDLPLGLILNFAAPSMRYGIKRIINPPHPPP